MAVWIDPQALAWLEQSPVPPEATYKVTEDCAHAGVASPITVAVTALPNNNEPANKILARTCRCFARFCPTISVIA
jgi:hypothetical protein